MHHAGLHPGEHQRRGRRTPTSRLRAAGPLGPRAGRRHRTDPADADAVAAAKAEIDSATARLREKQLDGTFGVRYLASGERMAWGNAVIGICNPLAPPLLVNRDPSGKVWCDFHLGAAYEGPPATSTGELPPWFWTTCSGSCQ
ncbi:thioesterase superfamily protein [Mycobacterium xenopi 4042]|uniref:Thioesterase superfamily protein n=1 Tax=Mycobacterium xenopi 4042 TaxID=1299334 RepID=X8BEF8_MYCXE|nr:thioesterase superfamily protein [Mycobacterium xenopi 4042]